MPMCRRHGKLLRLRRRGLPCQSGHPSKDHRHDIPHRHPALAVYATALELMQRLCSDTLIFLTKKFVTC